MLHEKNQAVLDIPVQASTAYPLPSAKTLRIRFPWYVVLSLVLLTATFSLLLVVRASARLLPASADVFAPYQAIAPGQSVDELEAYSCQRPYQSGSGHDRLSCMISAEAGAFRSVSIIAADRKVTGITFSPSNMRLVDLVWRWGRPDRVYKVGGKFEMQWYQRVNAVAEIGRRYSLQALVSRVTVVSSGF